MCVWWDGETKTRIEVDEEVVCMCLSCVRQVYAMPTLLFIKDGKIKQRAEGAMLAPKIKDLTEHIFFQGCRRLAAS